ncbi:MAG TPA: sugar kinase [Candidatus Nanopelagicaceae bacterium]|nr:sugar kinase [Candidatus Nanopelagicaceae bacterium]
MNSPDALDVATFGEAMLRLSVPIGSRLGVAPAFDVHVGGSESNLAVALARLGRRVGWTSRLPNTALGVRVADTIRAAGVDVTGIRWVENARLGTFFVELRGEPSVPHVIYDRVDSACCGLTANDLDWSAITSARLVHLTGITPALSLTCKATALEAAERVRSSGAMLSVDVNYRAKLWPPAEAAATVRQLMRGADLVICSREDAKELFDLEGPASEVACRLAELAESRRVVITVGADGAAWCDEGVANFAEGMTSVAIVDRIGAGDAFAAGVIDGLLSGDFASGIRIGIAMATITLGTSGDVYPGTRDEAMRLAGGFARGVDR